MPLTSAMRRAVNCQPSAAHGEATGHRDPCGARCLRDRDKADGYGFSCHSVSHARAESARSAHAGLVEAVGGITEHVADLTTWCVGPATADAAEAAGFQRIVRGDGNSDELARLILSSECTEDGFLHIANSAAAGNLVAQLSAAKCDARFLALYETVPASALQADAVQTLRSGSGAVVLVHSAKAADVFAALSESIPMVTNICVAISEAAAAPLKSLQARALISAVRPNEDALMEALLMACKEL